MPSAEARRLLFWLPLGLLGLAAIAWLFRPQPVAVDFATIGRGQLRVTVSDDGETRVRDVFVVSAPVPGRMQRIELEAGDAVQAGETVIARIEPSDPSFLDVRSEAEARAALQAAEAAQRLAAAAVERAEAEVDFAEAEFRRYQGLAERDTVSANDLDAAERRARTARAARAEAGAALRVREGELAQARARLMAPGTERPTDPAGCECVNVYSPVSGRVLRVLRESEGVVASGAPLVEVGDPQQLEVVVDLLSTDAVRVRPGQRVLIEAWGGDPPLAGIVRRVEPFGFTKVSALGIEEQRVNVVIDFAGDGNRPSALGHGYRVEPRIVLAEADDVLKVPRAALFRDGERWAVFVDDGGRATLRAVTIGLENGLEAEVVDGLAAGERVVLQPSDRISDGERVRARS